jgi:hypothetical protein
MVSHDFAALTTNIYFLINKLSFVCLYSATDRILQLAGMLRCEIVFVIWDGHSRDFFPIGSGNLEIFKKTDLKQNTH